MLNITLLRIFFSTFDMREARRTSVHPCRPLPGHKKLLSDLPSYAFMSLPCVQWLLQIRTLRQKTAHMLLQSPLTAERIIT